MKMMSIVLMALVSTSLRSTDVSGVWDLEMHWPGDRHSTGVCTFTQEGEKLTGTCGGSDKFAVTGRVDEERVTWQLDVRQDGSEGRMTFAGEVGEEGKTIEGSCTIDNGQEGTFTMKRRR